VALTIVTPPGSTGSDRPLPGASVPEGHRWKGVPTSSLVILGLTVAAGVTYLTALLVGGHISGYGGFDDGVYFGAATRLVHGVVPYRDFVFVQPPGVLLALSPFALLGRITGTATGFEVARLFIVVVATANVALLGWLTRRRRLTALAVGLVVFAFHPDVAAATSTVLIEPFLILGCLIGMVLLFDGEQFSSSTRRWWGAGVAFGLAGSTKLWAALPFVLIIALATRERHPGRGPFTAGAVGAFLLVGLPFFLLAPRGFVHDVISTQAGRTSSGGPSLPQRLASLIGINFHASAGAAGAVVLLAVMAWIVVRSRRLAPLEAFGMVGLVAVFAAFLVSPTFYGQYGAFGAPFLALVAGTAVGRLGQGRTVRSPVVLAVALGLAAVVFVGHDGYATLTEGSSPITASAVDPFIAPGACVVTDTPALLLLSDRFTSSVAGCPQTVDWYGTELAVAGGWAAAGRDATSPAVQATWSRWLAPASAVVLITPASRRPDWGRSLQAAFRTAFPVVHHVGALWVYQRKPGPHR